MQYNASLPLLVPNATNPAAIATAEAINDFIGNFRGAGQAQVRCLSFFPLPFPLTRC